MDAITLNKASQFSKEEAFKMVYLNNMVQKIAQGTGRLIRSTRDKGVVCCLDSRFIRYIEVIKKCTPFCNFTNNIADVYDFSDKYITNRDKKRKVKEL
jgi:Rad3-related DNA helicase